MDKLKPCPFCGEKAELVVCRHGGRQHDYAYVKCNKCTARIEYLIDVEYSAADRCVQEWNRRADDGKI